MVNAAARTTPCRRRAALLTPEQIHVLAAYVLSLSQTTQVAGK